MKNEEVAVVGVVLCESRQALSTGWHLIWAPVRVPAPPRPVQLPANLPRKAPEDGPGAWAPEATWQTR